MKRIVIILCLVFLLGCMDSGKELKSNNQAQQTFEYKGQTYEIHTYFEEFLTYAEKAKANPEEAEQLYHKYVIDPLQAAALEKDDNQKLLNENGGVIPPVDPDRLKEDVQKLINRREDILKWAKESLKKSVDALPSVGKEVYILPVDMAAKGASSMYAPVGGTSGFSLTEDAMVVRVTPSFEKMSLKNLVAHEYHHLVYNEKHPPSFSGPLLPYVLAEGKAEQFAETVFPKYTSYISRPFSSKEKEKEVWNYLKENSYETDQKFKDILIYDGSSEGFSSSSGYRISKQIMKSFVNNNPDTTIKEWTFMPANMILERSDYREKFKAS